MHLTDVTATPSPRTATHKSDSERGRSPPVLPVPLVQPKYQRKWQDKSRQIHVSNERLSSDELLSASDVLRQRSVEALTVTNGKATYSDDVTFETFAMYRHGKHHFVSNSVGISKDGDLVLHREEISEKSESDGLALKRRGANIDSALCLDPNARRPLTDQEKCNKVSMTGPKYKKYPGIKCPKNRRLRNRLHNDFLVCLHARKIHEETTSSKQKRGSIPHDANKDEWEEYSDSDEAEPATRLFPGTVPEQFIHVDETKQRMYLEKMDSYNLKPKVVLSPNSGEARFQLLNKRLQNELRHAMGTSEFLSHLIYDLDDQFAQYVQSPPVDYAPLQFTFRDGYARLISHAVATYYKLQSESHLELPSSTLPSRGSRCNNSQQPLKVTVVSFPVSKKLRTLLELPKMSLTEFLRGNSSNFSVAKRKEDEDFATPPLQSQETGSYYLPRMILR